MIIKSLDDNVVAVASIDKGGDFKPLPKGNYVVKLKDIGEWKVKTLTNFEANVYDDKFQAVKDAGGHVLKELIPVLDTYNNQLTFVVEAPEAYKGRLVWFNLSTHPNVPWAVPNFLHAMGMPNLRLRDIAKCKDTKCKAYITVREDEYPDTDDDGFDIIVKKVKNDIRSFKVLDTNDLEDEDLDI